MLLSQGGLLRTGQWQHVAFTYDRSSGTAKFYVNGIEVATKALGTVRPQTTHDFYLGVRVGGPDTGSRFVGQVDEVSLYRRALAPAEVAAIYNVFDGGKCPGTAPPVIFEQPQDLTLFIGQIAGFGVVGDLAETFQWYHEELALPGETASRLQLTNVQAAEAGGYRVVLVNDSGAVTSRVAQLTVNRPPPCVPIPTGLSAWWRLEDDARDARETSHGNLSGNPTFANGEVGLGLVLDGVDDEVRFPAS